MKHRFSSDHGWKTLSGRFTSIVGANISCMCAKSPEGLSPSAHLADGCLDLVLVRHTSRLQHLRHMIRITKRASDQVWNTFCCDFFFTLCFKQFIIAVQILHEWWVLCKKTMGRAEMCWQSFHLRNKTCSPCLHSLVKTKSNAYQ